MALNTPVGCNPSYGVPTGYPASCYDSNGQLTSIAALNVSDTNGNVFGSACFPSVNDNPWTTTNPKCISTPPAPPPACGTTGNPPLFVNSSGALFGGEAQPDGLPDGYPNPSRNYQAIEFEVNKALSHNWALIANWRIARLIGNFEGAFRNDNGQADPGISSLYDLTPGLLGTLGFQLIPGHLNADRLHIVNIYPTYIFDKGWAKGLVVTPGVKIQSGVPLTTLQAQEDYGNNGEVPIFGRGDLGRSPVTGTVDIHLDYPWRISETKSLHFAIDMLNIADTRRNLLVNQFQDLSFGVHNVDFQAPGAGNSNAEGQNSDEWIRSAVQRSFPRGL